LGWKNISKLNQAQLSEKLIQEGYLDDVVREKYSLKHYTKAELIEVLENQNLTGFSKLTKPQLIDKIERENLLEGPIQSSSNSPSVTTPIVKSATSNLGLSAFNKADLYSFLKNHQKGCSRDKKATLIQKIITAGLDELCMETLTQPASNPQSVTTSNLGLNAFNKADLYSFLKNYRKGCSRDKKAELVQKIIDEGLEKDCLETLMKPASSTTKTLTKPVEAQVNPQVNEVEFEELVPPAPSNTLDKTELYSILKDFPKGDLIEYMIEQGIAEKFIDRQSSINFEFS
jgi:hypothetical protein